MAVGGGWVQRIDASVWEQYTSDTRYRQVYDAGKNAHLLRIIQNTSQHLPERVAEGLPVPMPVPEPVPVQV